MAGTKVSGTQKNWDRYYCAELKWEQLYNNSWRERHEIYRFKYKADLIQELRYLKRGITNNVIRNIKVIQGGEYKLEPTGDDPLVLEDILA